MIFRQYPWKWGHVYKLSSERFGTNDMLCAKIPLMDGARTLLFPLRKGTTTEALHLGSVEGDEVVQEWPTLAAYFADQPTPPSAEKGSGV
jgi:hypothetical protein